VCASLVAVCVCRSLPLPPVFRWNTSRRRSAECRRRLSLPPPCAPPAAASCPPQCPRVAPHLPCSQPLLCASDKCLARRFPRRRFPAVRSRGSRKTSARKASSKPASELPWSPAKPSPPPPSVPAATQAVASCPPTQSAVQCERREAVPQRIFCALGCVAFSRAQRPVH
jgi:hypothetical protein